MSTLADAQDVIRNFQVANRNSTHITFSWDIVDGYYSSDYISNFRIYYRERPHTGYSSYIGSISYSNSDLIKIGASFQCTTTVTSFGSYGQYVMWVYVYRPGLTPSYALSDQIYVEVGRSMATCRRCMTALVAVLHNAHILPILPITYHPLTVILSQCSPPSQLQGRKIAIEVNIQLWPSQTCHEFTVSNT